MENEVKEVENLLGCPIERENMEEVDDDQGGRGGDQKGSGSITHKLSNLLISKRETEKLNEENKEDGDDEKEEKKEVKGGGGIFDHIISTLIVPLSPRAGGGATNRKHGDGSEKSEQENKEETFEEVGGGGRGGTGANSIIGSIVSHLPNLPDDAVPTAEEAAILIHSIVHD